MKNKFYDFFTPLNFPISRTIDKKIHHKKHTIKFEIWINHIKIKEIKFHKYKEARRYMNEKYQLLYDEGECMIYCYINNIKISYWSFMEKKYYIEE